MNIVQALRTRNDLLNGKGTDKEVIEKAEREMGITFSSDYREYLLSMSIAAYDGHELTGLSKSKRTNVIEVTKKMHIEYPQVSKDWYVIEEVNMDGIVIWQDGNGRIYGTAGNAEACYIAETLSEYVLKK